MMRPPARPLAARPKALTALLGALLMVAGVLVSVPAQAAPVAETAIAQTTPKADSGIVRAADLSQFRPGNIVSDAVFYNGSTMSEAQIQAFLNSKVTACRSGYVCLKDKTDLTRAIGADAMCNAYNGGGVESAARIIFKVAQACGINPQALIVMLQKEQGLVTDTYPYDSQYRIAMGQGCPDTAACDSRYFGFFNQVHGAAWQLKRYANPPGTSNYFTWYAPGKTWNVRYHPNIDCGSSPVYIENKATAALYYYTPYQPNAAALRAGYGTGDGCSSYGNRNFYQYFTDWFGSTQGGANNPFGNVEVVQAQPGNFRVRGWAIDPDTTDPIEVHVYVGGYGYAVPANLDRPDVGAAYPGRGSRHGFDTQVPATVTGATDVCFYGINAGPGTNVLFGCVSTTAMAGPPVGAFESATGVDGGIEVKGWVLDPDTAGATEVHVYVGSNGVALRADQPRPEVGANYPAYGANHGFAGTIRATPGTHQVCAYAINVGVGGNTLLSCRSVVVPGEPDLGRTPIGFFESLGVSGTTATAAGWALDPDTAKPIAVHLYVNGAGREVIANKSRPDIGAAYPASGADHGFVEQFELPTGRSEVCAYGINSGPGGNSYLGCRTVIVAAPDLGRAPTGFFESLTVSGATATAAGWTLDPDTSSPIAVHLYVNGAGREYIADKSRPDIGAAFPESGANHGFVEQLSLSPGRNDVCAYGINSGAGGNSFLGCRTVTVASTPARAPIGHFESAVPVAGGAAIAGWALDPDTTSPIEIHVYVGSTGRAFLADKARPDVGAAYRLGDNHGFNDVVPLGSGSHRICVYGINAGPGDNLLLGCRDVTMP